MLGGMVDLQTRGQPAGLLGREGLLEGAHPRGMAMLTNQTEPCRLRIRGVEESVDLQGPVPSRLARADTDQAPPPQWLGEEQDVGGALPLVGRVLTLGFARFRRPRLSALLAHRHGLFSHAPPRDLGIIRRLVDC